MTNLTEQLKKGELQKGWYWCKCYNEETKLLYYDGDSFELDDPETKNYYFFLPKDIAEITILAPVPSFELWKAVHEQWKVLLDENIKLKELLKECQDEIEYLRKHYKGNIDHLKNNTRLDKEINQVLGES
jgi:hypothetical protein